ncbi:phospholipid/cholesterol/gamma-HCH transport system substrate-binding protein [Mumia flava]|uniref:Phospholipid/cholesterol/gamma-HCH transport system substrate-binding protein n=1 Tax=Mumia flava TaxID=1348852 RepID=A0A0B2BNA9_9ACTN|nr:MCE family protein [Mumia flava]PJJ58296.1 phospholipid/cholesterol/gamma-HCH transport system substrate-binding protein [Mumia flava]
MKPIRERNPVVVGFVGLALIFAFLAVAAQADRLPLIGGGPTYAADFTEVGGLKAGDDVRMAGVLVGEVEDLELQGDTVRVSFRMQDESDRLLDETTASVRIKTLLGTMYVSLDPAGAEPLAEGEVIPAERTRPPYDIVMAFSDLTETTTEIDTEQLAYAMSTLGDVTERTPDEFQQAVEGVTSLSETLASRDEQIERLLENVDGLSGVLAASNDQIVTLFEDGGVLFEALSQRRQAIHDVLVGVQEMSVQIEGLIADTQDDLKPALRRLAGVVEVLERNRDDIDTAIEHLPAYYTLVANSTANGPWLDGYMYNLLSILGVGSL